MVGYDKAEALAFILKRIRPQDHAALADKLEALVGQAIDADLAFMLETGVIRVGSVYGAYYDWLAQTIARFSSLHPGIEIRFLQGHSSGFYSSLAEHEVDFCIVSRREGDYDFFPLRKDPLVAWVPKDHPRVKDGFYPLLDIEMLCI